jgi:hypothetical protein
MTFRYKAYDVLLYYPGQPKKKGKVSVGDDDTFPALMGCGL